MVKMTDEQIIKYVRNMIVNNLYNNDCHNEAVYVCYDTTNKILLEHIVGLIELFKKAKEILERGKNGK